jgi:two-component system sensor histidine kinase DesK
MRRQVGASGVGRRRFARLPTDRDAEVLPAEEGPPALTTGTPLSSRGVVSVGLAVLVAFSAVLLFFPVRDLLSDRLPGWAAVLGWLGLTVGTALHVWVVGQVCRPAVLDRRTQLVALVETVLFLLLMLTGGDWIAIPLFGLSDLLLVTAGRVRLVCAAAVSAVYVPMASRFYHGPDLAANLLNFTVVTAFCYGMTGLIRCARELDAARSELARVAIGQERLRVARDLHDTLGRSISIALIKLELAERLAERDADRAGAEAVEARELLRSAMNEMQDVVEGMRDVSLRREIESACSLMSSAGVVVTKSIDDSEMDGILADAVSWVVREATTNVVRHSAATWCQLTLTRRDGRIQMRVANDGVPADRRVPGAAGNGVRGMRERMAALGGSLSIRTEASGEYVLLAEVPDLTGSR